MGSSCTATMVLPPQRDGVRLKCDLQRGHAGLHCAPDPDKVLRRWPADDSPAGQAAQGEWATKPAMRGGRDAHRS